MKKLFTVLFILITAKSFAQNPVPLGAKNSRVYVQGLFCSDSLTNLHLLDSASNKLAFGGANLSYRLSRESNGRVYQAIPPSNYFVLFDNVSGSGSTTDTTSLSNRINQKVSYSDTASMLVGYVRAARLNDTASAIRTGLNTKVAYSDTAAMLAPYATYAQVALKLNITDTANIKPRLTAGTNVTITGTYPALTINSSSGGGAFYDSVLMATQYRLDSTRSNIYPLLSARVKYTDTAAMLSPYLRSALGMKYTDTATLSNRINLKLNISDTASMLSPYLRSALAASTYAPISTTVTLTGSQTLTNKTLTAPVVNVGSDATGDMYYRNASGLYTRLAIGSAGQELRVVSGIPAWRDTVAAGGGGSGWGLTGNAGTTGGTSYVGTSDNQRFDIRANATIYGKFYTNGSVALGELPTCSGNWGIALGYNAITGASNHEIAIGLSTQANSLRALAIGANSTSNATDGICISSGTGENETVTGGTTIGAYGGIRMPTTGTTVTVGRSAGIALGVTSTTAMFVPPVMTATQAEAISTKTTGGLIYSTDGSGVTITSAGWWGWTGTTWNKLN